MRKEWLAIVAVGLMAVWAAPASSAVVLCDNGGPDFSSGFYSDPVNNGYEAYNQFTLAAPSTITGMEWWGFYSGNTPPVDGDIFSYDVQSYPGSAGQPSRDITYGLLTGLSVSDTGTQVAGYYEVYEYNASADITLPAGTYYLSIYDTASNLDNPFLWARSTDSATGTAEWSSYIPSAPFWAAAPEIGLAFNLTGNANVATPEPISLVFFGTGLVGLCGYVARRRSR